MAVSVPPMLLAVLAFLAILAVLAVLAVWSLVALPPGRRTTRPRVFKQCRRLRPILSL